jgi:tetratricopeptide (TPR) repeat protein
MVGSCDTWYGHVGWTYALAATFFGLWIVGVRAQDLNHYLAQGDAFHRQFDTHNAYRSYVSAYQLDSTNADVLRRLVYELIEIGNEFPRSNEQLEKYLESERLARRAVSMEPDSPDVHVALAMALERTAQYDGGKKVIHKWSEIRLAARKALELNPASTMGFYFLGRWHLAMLQTSWLLKGYARVTEGDLPEEPSLDTAERCFLNAIEIDNRRIAHFFQLGRTYVALDNWHDARLAFEEIIWLPVAEKGDRRAQRQARQYVQMIEDKQYAALKNAIEE